MQTIITKYRGPAEFRGSKMQDENSSKSKKIVIPYDHALSIDENHAQAAKMARVALEWTSDRGYPPMVAGSLPDGSTVWVFASPYVAYPGKIDN